MQPLARWAVAIQMLQLFTGSTAGSDVKRIEKLPSLPEPPEVQEMRHIAEDLRQRALADSQVGITSQRQQAIASCFFSSDLTLAKLSAAGMRINDAVATCGFGEVENKMRACTANTAGMLAAFAAAGSFITQAVSSCPETSVSTWQLKCSTPILNLVSGLAGIASAAGGMSQACTKDVPNKATLFNPISVSKAAGIAECVVNSNQAIMFLGRAGVQVAQATNGDCDMQTSSAAVCSQTITALLTSFALGGSSLAATVAKCSETVPLNFAPACAANIQALVGAILKVANFASAMAADRCVAPPQDGTWWRRLERSPPSIHA
eukprot:TRINITY_DN88784_c0_g1_i1.p1 TRINITY_DN88784_c0_g1~~TRINITY_DN88784_c0_g1_i1.p1  ORF type:complete len:320 (+),score=55.23 TRINITY_DN88784_c0_g1_i1:150-1109(+)